LVLLLLVLVLVLESCSLWQFQNEEEEQNEGEEDGCAGAPAIFGEASGYFLSFSTRIVRAKISSGVPSAGMEASKPRWR